MGNAQSTVPYGAQISAVNASLQCTSFYGAAADLAYVAVTAPLSVAVQQPFYFSDLTAFLYLDNYFAIAALDIGPNVFVNMTMTFDVTNASPSTFSINATKLITFPLPDQAHLQVLPFQAAGSVLAPFGPFTPQDVRQPVELKIRSVIGLAAFVGNATTCCPPGASGIPTSNLDCDQVSQRFEYTVASVNVRDGAGPALQPANGFPGQFPPTPVNTRANVANVPISCGESNMISASHAFNYTISATGPAFVRPGDVYNFTNINNFFTAPGDLIADLDASYGTTGETYLEALEASSIPVTVAGSSPSSYDVSTNYVASDQSTPNPLRTGRYVDGGNAQSLTFPLPNWGFLTLPNTTVTDGVGSRINLSFKGFTGFLSSTDTRQGLAGSETLTCEPQIGSDLLSAPVIDPSTKILFP